MASFEILVQLGKLQIITDHAHYENNKETGNPVTGWGHIAMIEDLGFLMPGPLPAMATKLKKTWQENWERLGKDESSAMKITEAITVMRNAVRSRLKTIS